MKGVKLPDFFIAGVPKCGTTSVHSILSAHPMVCMGAKKEPNVLAQDIRRFEDGCSDWLTYDWDRNRSKFLMHYEETFRNCQPGQLRGDGTPGYCLHRSIAKRIAELCPSAKLIFMLRHPTDRLWSSYWHRVAHFRATLPFWRSIREEPRESTLHAGLYLRMLQPYFDLFPRAQIITLTLEELQQTPEILSQRLFRFLHLEPPSAVSKVARNPGKFPVHEGLQLVVNAWLARQRASKPIGPNAARPHGVGVQARLVQRLSMVAFRSDRPTPMPAWVRSELDEYYRRENVGLSVLIGTDLRTLWGLDI